MSDAPEDLTENARATVDQLETDKLTLTAIDWVFRPATYLEVLYAQEQQGLDDARDGEKLYLIGAKVAGHIYYTAVYVADKGVCRTPGCTDIFSLADVPTAASMFLQRLHKDTN